MTRTSLVIGLAAAMFATVGCASKNYVKQQTTPLINKTNELDDLTAKNSKDIKDVDARAQQGIQQVQAKAAEVDQKAQAAASESEARGKKPHRKVWRAFGTAGGDTITSGLMALPNELSVLHGGLAVIFCVSRGSGAC